MCVLYAMREGESTYAVAVNDVHDHAELALVGAIVDEAHTADLDVAAEGLGHVSERSPKRVSRMLLASKGNLAVREE